MKAQVKPQVTKVEEDHRLAQELQQQFSKHTCQTRLAARKVESGEVNTLLAQHPRKTWMKDVHKAVDVVLCAKIRGITTLALHRQRIIDVVNERVSCERRHYQKKQELAQRKPKLQVATC